VAKLLEWDEARRLRLKIARMPTSVPRALVQSSGGMALLPDAGIETINDKLKMVLKLRSATVNDIPMPK
jgi:hypothetical protein